MQKIPVKTIVAIGVGTAIFFLLARFVSIPVFANTNITFQYAILSVFAALFGPLAGLLIGLFGHALTDLSFGYGIWWSWVIVSAVIGLAYGFFLKGLGVDEGNFDVKQMIRFNIVNIVVHFVGWGLIAPILDILIYAEPSDKVFVQGIVAAIANIISTAIVGTILLYAYSKTRTKSGSLHKD